MIHVSASCNPTHHTTGSHYLNGDTAGFNQLMNSSVFKDFPSIKFIIPHGGGAGAVPLGPLAVLAQDAKLGLLSDLMLNNIFFSNTLCLSSAWPGAAGQGHSGRQHSVRLGNDRRGSRHRSGNRASLRRHQAVHRPTAAVGGGQVKSFRRQCTPRIRPALQNDRKAAHEGRPSRSLTATSLSRQRLRPGSWVAGRFADGLLDVQSGKTPHWPAGCAASGRGSGAVHLRNLVRKPSWHGGRNFDGRRNLLLTGYG